MVAIVVRFELKDEAAARGFDALVEETASAIQASEPDTLIYAVHRVGDAPLSRVFYELYASRDAHGSVGSLTHQPARNAPVLLRIRGSGRLSYCDLVPQADRLAGVPVNEPGWLRVSARRSCTETPT